MYNNHNLYTKLRAEYPEFIYSGYNITEFDDSLKFEFHFIIPGLSEFKPCWSLKKITSFDMAADDKKLNELVFSLGMVELVSYWKTTCSPDVKINCRKLSNEQIGWWKKLYKKGLGEFFYINKIKAAADFMDIISLGDYFYVPEKDAGNNENENNPKILIPVGGGKDSAVTLELLKNHGERLCYMINPGRASLDTVSAAGVPVEKTIIARRVLDENMLGLNKRGFLNGHTPFSAVVAFSAVIAAYIHKIKYVALSNESSASEPTVLNSEVNHQYSKSLEFESDFIDYEARNIASGVRYFSLLRPLTELGIAKIFSKPEKYHAVFKSCNIGSKKDIWCANCPKCLFVYIILSPFLPEDKLINIFGKNMLNDLTMTPFFEQLTGVRPEKPFECVGSRAEVNAALQELLRQYGKKNAKMPELVRYYSGLNIKNSYNFSEMCNYYDTNNHLPEQFIQAVKKELK